MENVCRIPDEWVSRAHRKAKLTGVPHSVIDVSQGGGRGYFKVVAEPINDTIEGRYGFVTRLYTADPPAATGDAS